VVDNRPGGNILGYELIARAAPDGYNLGMLTNSFTTNPGVHARLPYDTFKDFQPIAHRSSMRHTCVPRPSSGPK
jgi:tripartite-type tricarboxylate transporter receptor subunit TctC